MCKRSSKLQLVLKTKKPPFLETFLQLCRRSLAQQWWRWGELNPRPEPKFWVFYGCSFSCVLLGSDHALKRANQQTQPECKSRAALRRNYSARFLNDASTRYEIKSGLTDFRLAYAARAKSARLVSAPIVCSGHLRVDATFTTRFSQAQEHCRNRSSPLLNYQMFVAELDKDTPCR